MIKLGSGKWATDMLKALRGPKADQFKVEFPDGAVWLFSGYVCGTNGVPIDLDSDISGITELFIQPTGPQTMQPAPPTAPVHSPPSIAHGTLITINGHTTAELKDIALPKTTRQVIDVTGMGDDHDSYVVGIRKQRQIQFNVDFGKDKP